MPRRRSRAGLFVRVAVALLFVAWLIREYYPFESPPRVRPGTNVLMVRPGQETDIYDHRFSIALLSVDPPPKWRLLPSREPQVQTATFQLHGADGSCQAFTDLPLGESVISQGAPQAEVLFWRFQLGRAWFEILAYPRVFDGDVAVAVRHSEQVYETDVLISVVEIHRPINLGPAAASPRERNSGSELLVTYSAVRPGGDATTFTDQSVGSVGRLDDFVDIAVTAVHPSEARFLVSAARDPRMESRGSPCPQPPPPSAAPAEKTSPKAAS